MAVLAMDLDGFKEVNDALGHVTGDRCCKRLHDASERRCAKTTRSPGSAATSSPCSCPRRGPAQVLEIVRRVREAIEQPIDLEGLPVNLAMSIGISALSRDGVDVECLLRCADTAMYVAKDTSLGYAFYDASVDSRAATHLGLIGDLRHAIADQELLLHYQPKIAVRSGRVVGVEALTRWQHASRGLVMPSEFIPVAQETSLIKELTLQYQRSGSPVAGMGGRGPPLADRRQPFPAGSRRSWFSGRGRHAARQVADARTMLKLEVTEARSWTTRRGPRTCSSASVRWACGSRSTTSARATSPSPYLKRLPIDEIKIDRSFVAAMAAHEDDEIIVRSTIELGHNLGLSVVAEGVECSVHGAPCVVRLRRRPGLLPGPADASRGAGDLARAPSRLGRALGSETEIPRRNRPQDRLGLTGR